MGDLIVLAVLGLVVGMAIGKLHKDKKKGGCCGNCSGCAGCSSQHRK
ncbi:MAG: FeoB-associated Cys-rich membrane protein [Faecousia sp.]